VRTVAEIDELHPDLKSLLGSVIHDRYRVDELLGRGGMGAVFKGYHLNLQRAVAIKVLHPEVGRDAGMSARFTREGQSVSRLDHPNCVRVSDFGTTEGGVRYLVMELLAGEELQASLGQPWAAARAIDVAMQILEGLDHAHQRGVVHRDLKPENVFMTVDHRGKSLVKLVDFGIAKLLDADASAAPLTREGMIFGTPRYMSPEQATGGKLDARTDLYAVGLLLYQMLAGHPPFRSDDAGALLRMHILAPPPELPSSVPPALAAVVMKLLEKSRNDRPASAREAIEALEQVRGSSASAAVLVPAAVPIPPHPAHLVAPNQPTQSGLQSWDSSASEITHETRPVSVRGPTYVWWHPWAAGAGAVLLLLMAFGAWQAVREQDDANSESESSPTSPSAKGQPLPRDDFNCSDGRCTCVAGGRCSLDCPREGCELGCNKTRSCTLACGEGCRASCIDASESCEITVGNGGTATCEGSGRCRVTCQGACEVPCADGNCDVTCRGDRGRKARRCEDTLVCGRDC
jgi:serine/threonine protein kinase